LYNQNIEFYLKYKFTCIICYLCTGNQNP